MVELTHEAHNVAHTGGPQRSPEWGTMNGAQIAAYNDAKNKRIMEPIMGLIIRPLMEPRMVPIVGPTTGPEWGPPRPK